MSEKRATVMVEIEYDLEEISLDGIVRDVSLMAHTGTKHGRVIQAHLKTKEELKVF